MWKALDGGAKLRAILEDFYEAVLRDERLMPFFEGVTVERVIGKQYGFMKKIFTGENCYFGDRPRNAHHWMVISNELFDYREDLLASFLRKHGVCEAHVKAWREIDEIFRAQIVKANAFTRKVGGVEMPLDGYETIELMFGTLCDQCSDALDAGTQATYHVRKGDTYCQPCAKKLGIVE